jgi:transcriptional regulator with XRE-family HTH domain
MASPECYEYADRVCAQLPGRLQALRAALELSIPGLAQRCGVTRAMLWRIESGKSIPTVHMLARLAPGLGMTLAALVHALEDGAAPPVGEASDPTERVPPGVCRRPARAGS